MKQLCIGQALECCGTHNGVAEDTALPADGQDRVSCFACIKSWSLQFGPCAKRVLSLRLLHIWSESPRSLVRPRIEVETAYELLRNDFDWVLVRSYAEDPRMPQPLFRRPLQEFNCCHRLGATP